MKLFVKAQSESKVDIVIPFSLHNALIVLAMCAFCITIPPKGCALCGITEKSVNCIDLRKFPLYNITKLRERRQAMAKHYKKGGNQDQATKLIILITAAINLATALIELIKRLLS